MTVSFRLPLPPIVFEVADQFLLLAIHRDNRITRGFKLLALLLDVPKLGITVRVATPLNGFLVRPQREAHPNRPASSDRVPPAFFFLRLGSEAAFLGQTGLLPLSLAFLL